MKAILSYIPLLLLAACTSADAPAPATPSAPLTFRVQTLGPQAAPVAPDDANQLTRLYVAERRQEHDFDHLHLHCPAEWRHTLTGGTYSLTGLHGQWYKFAFVCVPRWAGGGGESLLTEETPAERTCDYNRLLIDYNAVMARQQTRINDADTRDLNLYRRVIDRWVDLDATNTEDVELTRLTGELHIDMGIPADQFPHPVKAITLTLHEPAARAYIHDEAADRLILAPQAAPADRTYTLDFSLLSFADYDAAMRQRQHLRLCLLPQTLTGTVTITYKDTDETVTLPIGTDAEADETRVEVRRNRITTVLFNGMTSAEFEVRYAGFDDGGDAEVDVDDDKWNDVNP